MAIKHKIVNIEKFKPENYPHWTRRPLPENIVEFLDEKKFNFPKYLFAVHDFQLAKESLSGIIIHPRVYIIARGQRPSGIIHTQG